MSRGPNTRLADLFALTGWSKGELARLVNRRGAALGQSQLSTDTTRVRRWMERGEVPRDPVPRVLAALFTERLGRVVTIEDLGFLRQRQAGSGVLPEAGEQVKVCTPERAAVVLTEFTGMDLMLNRRDLMGAGAGVVAGSVIADSLYEWMGGAVPAQAAESTGARGGAMALPADDLYEAGPVGADEVAALENSVRVFRQWDAQRGGGLQRKAVVGQLNEVGQMLTYHHPRHLQQRLWGVAANLSVLAGWMSHDVGMEPTAQQYFVLGVQAAQQAGDRPRAAEALSRAARQMVHLGRYQDALDLLRVADARGGRESLPRTRAMLRTVEAWAYASQGQSQATRRSLGEAEDLFARDTGEEGPEWLQFFDEADLHGMEGLTYRVLAEHDPSAVPLAKYHAQRAIALRGEKRERSLLFDQTSMAAACYLGGTPDEAEAYARYALAHTGEMSSHRTWDRLRQVYQLTARYQRRPEVRELREDLRQALPRPAGPRTV